MVAEDSADLIRALAHVLLEKGRAEHKLDRSILILNSSLQMRQRGFPWSYGILCQQHKDVRGSIDLDCC